MFRKSICSGNSTYWRSSLRACLSVARSMIQRLLRDVSKHNENTGVVHRAYLCELAQKSVAIEAWHRPRVDYNINAVFCIGKCILLSQRTALPDRCAICALQNAYGQANS